MKLQVIVLALLVSAAVFAGFNLYNKPHDHDEIHYHAGFEIYKDGTRARFDSLEYMRIAPCTSDDDSAVPHDENDIIHLHDGIDNIVHIHGEGATWQGLFEYLRLGPEVSTVEAYLNNEPVADIAEKVIQPYDQAVFFINTSEDQEAKIADSLSRITTDYIKEVEAKGENCSK